MITSGCKGLNNNNSSSTCRTSLTPCYDYHTVTNMSYCAPGGLCSLLEQCDNVTGGCASNSYVCVVNSCCPPQNVCLSLSWTSLCSSVNDTTSTVVNSTTPAAVMLAWTLTGRINAGRSSHTSTLLANGKVLIAGGSDFSDTLNSAELYDSSSGTWALTNSLNVGRWGHTASILTNGQVLGSGGSNGSSVMASAELFDPPTGIWTITGGLNVRRWDHTSSLLTNGKVLVAAGYDNVAGINDAELY
ncbi:unnamed protein product [Rotaria socialis]|uniref:Uncharacterized protein n=1 Tax=Rotaria socialis TaxID=392032 RepID=A0A820XJG4_9BILA|nr:unnamed protein product [Rotaria socialis]